MPDWLIWTVAIASIVAAIAQVVGTWLQWFMLRELGDLDQDRDDWFERPTFRTYTNEELVELRKYEAERATNAPEEKEDDDSHRMPPFP